MIRLRSCSAPPGRIYSAPQPRYPVVTPSVINGQQEYHAHSLFSPTNGELQVSLVLDHRRLAVIYVDVVGRRLEGHDARESRLAALAVHPVPIHQFVPT
jgi:hypothetical protein